MAIFTVLVISILSLVIVCLSIQNSKLRNTSRVEKVSHIINQELFDRLPMSIVVITPSGLVTRINKMILNELNLSEEDVINKDIRATIEIIHDKKNVFPDYIEKLNFGEDAITFDTNTFIREPRKNIRFLISGMLKGIYEDGKLSCCILLYRNVLEERTQKHLMNIAISKTQIFPWSFDMDRNLMLVDPRYFEYLGLKTKDYTLTMEQFSDLVHPDDRAQLFEALGKQLNGNLFEAPVSYRLHRGDGTWEWFEAQSTYVGQLSDLPFRIIGICTSIQRHKDNENILNEALVKAQRSDELKSAFLANMSHEIRTPLNAVVGFSSILSTTMGDLEEQEKAEYAALIEKNANLLMMLISDILDLSKIESNTMEFNYCNVSLTMLLNDVISAQRINIRNGVELKVELPSQDLLIRTDPCRLGQVLNNLINNANKFTEKGYIRVGCRCDNPEVIELFVEDTGRGMSEEVQSHIFERFYKADSFVQGTGLGLVICRTIMDNLKGSINVTSEEGKGTCFTLELPLSA